MAGGQGQGGARQDAPPQIYRDIDAAMQSGDMTTAIVLARQALDAGMDHHILFGLRAYGHETEGHYLSACIDLERALIFEPGDPRLLTALSRCNAADGRMMSALVAADSAIAADPTYAAAHHNRAFALETMGELDSAWDAYSRALELDPGMVEAAARLAWLSARRGDRDEARAHAVRVLQMRPGQPMASAALIIADLSERKYPQAEARARAVAADETAPAQSRAQATSFAADAVEGQGRFAEAFDLYVRANDAMKAIYRDRMEGPGAPPLGRAVARRLAQEFAVLPPAGSNVAAAAPPDEAAGLVFLMGFPRSGTTLLGQILAAHSRVALIEERPLLEESVELFIAKPGGLARLAAMTALDIAQGRELFWSHVRKHAGDVSGRIVVDQSPLNTLHLPVIARLFPEAKVVFAVRDPRDTVLGCFRQRFVVNIYLYEFLSLQGSAEFYDLTMNLARMYREALPLSFLDVRNEDVVADFDGQTRALCDHVGIAWEENMRNFQRGARERRISTPSALQVARGLNADGIGRWRSYAEQMAPVLPLLTSWAGRFGYPS